MATSFMHGLLSQDVIPVVKHFPGHGTKEDSHHEAAVLHADEESLFEL